MELAVGSQHLADLLPERHRVSLGYQLRKSSTSVPSNIAEGHAHRGERIYVRHVRIAIGSLAELDTQVELAIRLRLIDVTKAATVLGEIVRLRQMLYGLERARARRIRIAIGARMLVVPIVASIGLAL